MLQWRALWCVQAMNEACLDMLERATVVGATETFMTVFRPAHPLRPHGACCIRSAMTYSVTML